MHPVAKTVAGVALLLATQALAADPPTNSQWPSYGQNTGGSNYSPLKQITPQNASKLTRAWTYNFGAGVVPVRDQGLDYRWEVQPLLINGILYISTPTSPKTPTLKSTVTALVPETGKVLWKYESPLNIHGRGLAYWPGDASHGGRLYFGTDEGYLSALDIKTGKLAPDFGVNGTLDAYIGVASAKVAETRRGGYTIPNPAMVFKNLIITGARPGEQGPPGPRGDIRAWDAATGKLVWTFHTVPQPGDPGYETYPKPEETQDRSGANVWSTMALDAQRGILFAPLGDLNGRAEGSELYAGSLVALDANTGKIKWHHQLTHKDIWDWDMSTPPVLAEVKRDGKNVPVIVQSGKAGFVFVFERESGKAVYEVKETPTPRANQPGDIAWPTQPIPATDRVARQNMTRDDIPDVYPGQKDYCTKFWDDNKIVSLGPYGQRQPDRGTIRFPTTTGGPNWGPPSYDPTSGLYIVNAQNMGTYQSAGAPGRGFGLDRPAPGAAPAAPATPPPPPVTVNGVVQSGFQFTIPGGGVVPCVPLPWGQLTAFNVNTGKVVWTSPLGDWEALGDKGKGLGARNLGGNIATAGGVVFIGATNDRRFRAFESKTGKLLWDVELEASAHSTPMTFMGKDGKQYVVTTAGGGTSAGAVKMADSLVAFRLP
jgi:glucose dehydrogenase